MQLYDLETMNFPQEEILDRHKMTTNKVHRSVRLYADNGDISGVPARSVLVLEEEIGRLANNDTLSLHWLFSLHMIYRLNAPRMLSIKTITLRRPPYPIRIDANPVNQQMSLLGARLEPLYYKGTDILIRAEQRGCFFTNLELAEAYHHLRTAYPSGRRKYLIEAASNQLDYLRGVCNTEYLLVAHEHITKGIARMVDDYERTQGKENAPSDLWISDVDRILRTRLAFKHWRFCLQGAMEQIVLDSSWLWCPTLFRVKFGDLIRRKPSAKSSNTVRQMKKLGSWLEIL